MFRKNVRAVRLMSVLVCGIVLGGAAAGGATPGGGRSSQARETVDRVIRPLQAKYGIPGVAVAVTLGGRHRFYNYGVASQATRTPVNSRTLFEIGSLSKTFDATLASYAQVEGRLSFADRVSRHLPALRGSRFDDVRLLNLGTHTSGLPLFVPGSITDEQQLLGYLRAWRPPHPIGSHRIYSNVGIGTLGLIAARSLNESYDDAIEKRVFPALGMTHSYLHVPPSRMKDYAQGYTAMDKPIRLQPGMLASEAYGVKACSEDLIRFLDANIEPARLDRPWRAAIRNTHIGYYRCGPMVQDLIWEQYPYPTPLADVLAGNTHGTDDIAARPITPPRKPQTRVFINKTGSTNGFAAYAAFIPSRKIGIVILANKSYPIAARVTAAYWILEALAPR